VAEILFALLIFLLAFAGLAVGVLAGRRGVTGSCGGLNQLPGVGSDCGGACRAPGGICPNGRHSHRGAGDDLSLTQD
jgi:uncharacterized protein